MNKFKRYMGTREGKAKMSILFTIFAIPVTALVLLFGTNAFVATADLEFTESKTKYSQSTVMSKVQRYKDGVFTVKEEEEGSTESGSSSSTQQYDPSDATQSTVIPVVTTGSSHVAVTLPNSLKLYDGPTMQGNAYTVNVRNVLQTNWLMCAAGLSVNKYALNYCTDQTTNYIPGAGAIDASGRHRVAVGPAVTNPNFKCDNSRRGVNDSEAYVNTHFDVVLKGKDGKKYYWPCVIGCCKVHTYPTGIIQTGKHVHYGGTYEAEGGSQFDDKSVVETVGPFSEELENALYEYKFVQFLVYKK